VIVEKNALVSAGAAKVWQTQLMMKNEDAPHLFRISGGAPHKEAGAHMVRTGVG